MDNLTKTLLLKYYYRDAQKDLELASLKKGGYDGTYQAALKEFRYLKEKLKLDLTK